MSEDRQRYNVGAVKLPEAERDVARAVFAEHPERFSDVIGADTPDDHERYPVGTHTTYTALLTEREAEQFSRASNARYVEPDRVHYNVTCGTEKYLPRPDAQRYLQGEVDAYPTLTGANVPIGIIDEGTTAALRSAKNITLLNRGLFLHAGSGDPTGEIFDGYDHGCLVAGNAVPFGGQLIDAFALGNDTLADSDLASAVTWCCTQAAKLVNLSLTTAGEASVVDDAFNAAGSQDIAFFIAAGNDGQRGLRWPSEYNLTLPYVHSVMSVDMSTGQRSTFTNYGPWQTGMAPGELVYTVYEFGDVTGWEGTSASSPHALQLAARIMSTGVSARQAAAALAATVRDIGVTDGQGATLGVYSMQAALRWLNKEPAVVITRPVRPQNPGLSIW